MSQEPLSELKGTGQTNPGFNLDLVGPEHSTTLEAVATKTSTLGTADTNSNKSSEKTIGNHRCSLT